MRAKKCVSTLLCPASLGPARNHRADGGFTVQKRETGHTLPSAADRKTTARPHPGQRATTALTGASTYRTQTAADAGKEVCVHSPGDDPAADINNDGDVDVDDLLEVILAWGVCGP
jgi:hypothetical protein